ncbi:MAG TPA: hypothetical protein VK892_16845 [Pyrinomonadaceae bacterium]|nr:hypothetical protein [Pyrinomonadaceae bacterium]
MIFCFSAFAQSTNQSYPTPVATNEISGNIPARALGDPRLTGYFYTFNANQGDVFINVVTSNFNGDIDVFAANGLRPLTKIVIYAYSSVNETGRVIYLRKPEKLILRVEGRTPNDDPATFRIKFAGSFVPAADVAEAEAAKMPEVKTENRGDIIVNSVGTIIGVKPKPTPSPEETVSKAEEQKKEESRAEERKVSEEKKNEIAENKDETEQVKDEAVAEKEPEKKETEAEAEIETPKEEVAEKPTKKAGKKTEPAAKKTPPKTPAAKKPSKRETETAALANIRLIVIFKDGSKIERPMNEILRVNVDKGILTVVSKDGTIGRYSILDVAKMTIE